MEFVTIGGGLMLASAIMAIVSVTFVKPVPHQRQLAFMAVAVGFVGAAVSVI